MPDPREPYVARIVAVERFSDGDTWQVWIDMGWHCRQLIHVRLAGWDTPETQRRGDRVVSDHERAKAQEAKELARQWFESRLSDETCRVYVLTSKEEEAGGFNRWLGEVFSQSIDGSRDHLGNALHDKMLASAWPVRWHQEFDVVDPPA